MPEGYAVHYFARYQDGHEEGGTVVKDKEAAFAWMERMSRDPSVMMEFTLFELGKRVKFEKKTVVEEEVTKRERIKFE